ncbi:MAG: sigma 54-interacting transcriptional regulator [Blastocatellia bacterium]
MFQATSATMFAPVSLLLLDGALTEDTGAGLRHMLESMICPRVTLHHERIGQREPSALKQAVTDLMRRFCPKLVVWVPAENAATGAAPLLEAFRGEAANTPLIVAAAAGQRHEQLRELMEHGVADFITLPLRHNDALARISRLMDQPEVKPPAIAQVVGNHKLIGEDPAFLAALGQIPAYARCGATVLISGESGVGKEACAEAIHKLSPRRERPFVTVNCGAIPENLAESELFGHEKGAFTGAQNTHAGLIETAHGGTLFLDEIHHLPAPIQVKLLRFLQAGEYRRVGSNLTRASEARIIAATNRDLAESCRQGTFQHDLYYRINVLPLRLPALRERRSDIPVLAEHFRQLYSRRYERGVTGFMPDAMLRLESHDWPGNIRELENLINRAVAVSRYSLLRGKDLLLDVAWETGVGIKPFGEAKAAVVNEFERKYLLALLLACHGNMRLAAETAGKDERALRALVNKHRIDLNELRRNISAATARLHELD